MASQEESDEDDYMSEALLAKCGDTKPCLVVGKVVLENAKRKKHEESNRQHKLENKSKKVLEEESRTEGLSNAIASDNKGFRLLEKMGYKPGTALGKKGTGRIEPVPVELKSDRGGLGQESERKRRLDEVQKMRAEMAQKRARHEARWKDDIRAKYQEKEAEKDLRSSQLVCQQLNEEEGFSEPIRKIFWISQNDGHNEDDDDDLVHDDKRNTDDDDNQHDDDDDVGRNEEVVDNDDEDLSEMEPIMEYEAIMNDVLSPKGLHKETVDKTVVDHFSAHINSLRLPAHFYPNIKSEPMEVRDEETGKQPTALMGNLRDTSVKCSKNNTETFTPREEKSAADDVTDRQSTRQDLIPDTSKTSTNIDVTIQSENISELLGTIDHKFGDSHEPCKSYDDVIGNADDGGIQDESFEEVTCTSLAVNKLPARCDQSEEIQTESAEELSGENREDRVKETIVHEVDETSRKVDENCAVEPDEHMAVRSPSPNPILNKENPVPDAQNEDSDISSQIVENSAECTQSMIDDGNECDDEDTVIFVQNLDENFDQVKTRSTSVLKLASVRDIHSVLSAGMCSRPLDEIVDSLSKRDPGLSVEGTRNKVGEVLEEIMYIVQYVASFDYMNNNFFQLTQSIINTDQPDYHDMLNILRRIQPPWRSDEAVRLVQNMYPKLNEQNLRKMVMRTIDRIRAIAGVIIFHRLARDGFVEWCDVDELFCRFSRSI